MKTKQVIKRVAEYDQFGYPRWTSVTSEKRIFDDEDKMAVVAEYQAASSTTKTKWRLSPNTRRAR